MKEIKTHVLNVWIRIIEKKKQTVIVLVKRVSLTMTVKQQNAKNVAKTALIVNLKIIV